VQQFDKDTVTTANKLQKYLDAFARKEIDVLVGTQMLAKGHDYPDVTLAIVLGLDYVTALPDYRARERAMSLFVQIAGRAGRNREAEVIVQTNEPEFFTAYLGDYEAFLKDEIGMREGLYPPHRYLCRLLLAAKHDRLAKERVETAAEALRAYAPAVEVVGAGKAPIEKIAGKFRYHILLRAHRRTDLLKALGAVDSTGFEVDMDPVDFA
jgi:primosomal protein N' (replication factor Y)